MMFDFPTFVPTKGDHHRYNEEWYVPTILSSTDNLRYLEAHHMVIQVR